MKSETARKIELYSRAYKLALHKSPQCRDANRQIYLYAFMLLFAVNLKPVRPTLVVLLARRLKMRLFLNDVVHAEREFPSR